MRKLAGIALVLLLVLVWLVTRADPTARSGDVGVAPQPPRVVDPSGDLAVSESGAERAAREVPSIDSTQADDSRAVGPSAARERAEIHGRFLLSSGVPAADVALRLAGKVGNQERVMRYGLPASWPDLEATTTGDGRFSIAFDPPRAYEFTLDATLAGYCTTSWHWGQIEPRASLDVGDVTLVRGGSIRGRIVDTRGSALIRGWTVHAQDTLYDPSTRHGPERWTAQPDARSGEFVFDDVPPGRMELSAYSAIAGWAAGPVVVVREGGESRADIPYAGPDNERRIAVITRSQDYFVLGTNPAEILLRAPGVKERRATKTDRWYFLFEDLAPGRYTLEVRDPRFLPWIQEDVEPGTSVDVRLKGNAAVVLTVVDDATGAPVSSFALDVRFDNVDFVPHTYRVHEAQQAPPAGGCFEGLIPRSQTLTVRAKGFRPCEILVPDLKPGERRVLFARLVPGTRLVGRVVSGPERTPVARARVQLTPDEPLARSNMPRFDSDLDNRHEECDAAGRFAFEDVSPGTFTLHAGVTPLFAAEQHVTVTGTRPDVELEVSLPAPAWLAGKLIGPEGAQLEGLRVLTLVVGSEAEGRKAYKAAARREVDVLSAVVGRDGRFRAGPVPAGEVRVSVRLPALLRPDSRGSGFGLQPGDVIDLDTVVLAPNVDTQREFDLSASFPGSFALRVIVDGAPAVGFIAHVVEARTHETATLVLLGLQGTGRTGQIVPGTYRFHVYHERLSADFPELSGISCVSNVERTLRAGESATVEVDAHLVEGSVRFLDRASGQLLAGQVIALALDVDGMRQEATGRTDAEGRVTWRLPLGQYEVSAARADGTLAQDQSTIVDWAASGPSPAEVRISTQPR